MNEEHTIYLFKKYPKLFPAEDRKDPMKSLLYFGFECSDGWFKLIDKLCKDIQKEIDDNKVKQITVVQVKEKFSRLRYYVDCGTDKILNLIDKAEKESCKICEECGNPAEIRDDVGWWKTLCDSCYKKKMK